MVQQSAAKGQLPTHSFTIPPCASITWIRFNGYNLSPYLLPNEIVREGHPFKIETKLDRNCLQQTVDVISRSSHALLVSTLYYFV